VLYEVEQKEKTIEEGKSKLLFFQKEKELERSRNRIIILLLSVIGITAVGIMYIRYVRSKRKQQELFSQKLIEGIEEERSRIAKELHDDIGANLSLVKNKIYMNSEKGDKELFTQLNSDVSNVIEQTRGISHQLYPSYLYKLGLAEAIHHFLSRVERDTGITINKKIQDDIESFVSPSTKLHVFRILQELVNNTIKHAHASTIDLSLNREENGKIFMNYSDNGDGLKGGKSDGMGMISIKERVKILNGRMKIEPENEKGFKISFIFSVED
jgi:signal transduction histidine kinase